MAPYHHDTQAILVQYPTFTPVDIGMVIVADRELVEQGVEGILKEAWTLNVAFLVIGDPFG